MILNDIMNQIWWILSFIFPGVSQQVRMPNTQVWLANRTLIAGPAILRYGLWSRIFLCCSYRGCIQDLVKMFVNNIFLMKKCARKLFVGYYVKWIQTRVCNVKKNFSTLGRDLQQNLMILSKYHTVLSCFFFPIWKEEFQKKVFSFTDPPPGK